MMNPEDQRAQEIAPRFKSLTQLVYVTSGAVAGISIAVGIVSGNAGIPAAGLGAAALNVLILGNSKERASQTAASLLVAAERQWQQTLEQSNVTFQRFIRERESLSQQIEAERDSLRDQLRKVQVELASEVADLSVQLERKSRENQTLQAQFGRAQEAYSSEVHTLKAEIEHLQGSLLEKRHNFATHLDAIELQIIGVWEPLYQGLLVVCDRYDPSRPATDLDYAGKPAELSPDEAKQWRHYRQSLTAYDVALRGRVEAMSEACETHDEAYGFFLNLIEEIAVNYCKLWGNAKDLELFSHHEAEKRAIYQEFQQFREEYQNTAQDWMERSEGVEQGFTQIEKSFKAELADLQERIIQAEAEKELLEGQLSAARAPRLFRGSTSIDRAGNRIIKHFAESEVILDAVESLKIPGGFQLRFKVDRNPDGTRLAESEFDKHCEELGLWGLSQRPLDFDLDTRNFMLSVDLYGATGADATTSQRSTQVKRTQSRGQEPDTPDPADIAAQFHALDCYSAGEFEEVVSLECVPRVRIVAGSTGGKSPLMELFACAIAQIQKGELWLINPIPGSPKDWFSVPGVIPPGSDGIEVAIEWLQTAHDEFSRRRKDLPGAAKKPFITILCDEINAIARAFPDLGTVMKDFYQLSDHTRMGFLTAGQGGNVSGVSGGMKTGKTGNASKLMAEDFENTTQVFTAAAANTWIEKNLSGKHRNTYSEQLSALNELCETLNQAEGKSAYPTDPTAKIVT
ncbi:MAG: OmpH family outer membrane protein, partial [Cyanobacteria bacterium J06638_22]